MHWVKQGKIFGVSGEGGWMNTHAQVPTVLAKEDEGLVRVYFATRVEQSRSQTTFVDLDINDLSQVIRVNEQPLLELGRPGMFDEFGIMPSSVIESEGQVFLYYSGWSQSGTLPYNNYTGLAISKDGGASFERYSEGPIIDRTPVELYSGTSPCVYKKGDEWHMYYCSGVAWHEMGEKLEHTYDIKYATSSDGMEWQQLNRVVIPQQNEFEAITKPAVIELDGHYHMWFCYRGSENFRDGANAYRIGYAASDDLLVWERKDHQAGIDVSEEGWDSAMVAYPAVHQIGDEVLMFYNGNSFGKEGFGVAKLDMN